MCINSVKLSLPECSLDGKELFYIGDLALLQRRRVSIVGSRKPNAYAKTYTQTIAKKLANAGVCVVSGGAIGVDALAHKAAGSANTLMVAATGLEKRYPAINKNLIVQIEKNGLVLSQFPKGTPSLRRNFVLRNELIVALGEVLVVTYADLGSGTMRSVEYALKMGKEVFVLPHRLGESEATNRLLSEKRAEAIYDIDAFVARFGTVEKENDDPLLAFCGHNPTYEEVLKRFGEKVFEYELEGKIKVEAGRVLPA